MTSVGVIVPSGPVAMSRNVAATVWNQSVIAPAWSG